MVDGDNLVVPAGPDSICTVKFYLVDAFADGLFSGNPAGVCLVESALDEATMAQIAAECPVSETAFVTEQAGRFHLRWFTPTVEVDLCGHATLAAAFVLMNYGRSAMREVQFQTRSGILSVQRDGDLYVMDFPAWTPSPVAVTPKMAQVIGVPVLEAYLSRDLLLVVESEQTVRDLRPDVAGVAQIAESGVIVTAAGVTADFVYRFFAPNMGIPEDPVTGSAQSSLVPFWAPRLSAKSLTARQLSRRGGTLYCQDRQDRVSIAGRAVLYLQGEIADFA